MLKKMLAFGLCGIIAAFVLVGCGKETVPTPIDTDSGTVPTSAAANVNTSKDVEVARSFVNAIASKDYNTAISCLNVDEDKSFITAEDIEFSLPRTSFVDLGTDAVQGSESEYSSDYKSGMEHTTVTAVFTKGESKTTVSIPVGLNNKNEWKVDAPEFYHTNFTFRAPSGKVTITANGKPVTADMITNQAAGSLGKAYEYTLPYVGKKGVIVKVSCDNYEKEFSMATSSNNTEVDNNNMCYYDLDSDAYNTVLTYIKDTWNSMYKDFENGKNANDLMSYLSDDADSDIATSIINDFKGITKQGSFGNDDFKITEIRPYNDGDGAFYVTDDLLCVNFNYKLHWHYKASDTWMKDMKRTSNIVLKNVGGKYKIYELTDEKLFTECNGCTQDW